MKVAPTLVLAGALVLCAQPARASSGDPKDVTEGTLQTKEGRKTVPVPLEHTDVEVRIDGFFADVTVEQTFVNPYKNKIEAVYLFPLPANSAVNDMEIAIGDRTIAGRIKLRDEAKKIYAQAKKAGHVAALLTQERPNLFTQSVANIEPGAKVIVRLRYVQTLSYDDGAYELVYPMVAGPRHVPKSSKLTKEAAAAVQPAILPAGLRPATDISLSVDVDAGLPIRALASPSHTIDAKTPGGSLATVSIAKGDTIPNKDFILRYEVAGEKPAFAVVPHRAAGKDGAFFFMAQPPRDAAAAEITAKEMVFVIDTSSSMAGRPLDKAREAVRSALSKMHPDDTFQIVRFDDTASALGARPIANKPANVAHALAWLDAIEATGGTDMTTGIRAALEFPHDPARLRIVVFLTDGFIGNEDEILALVQEKLGPSRLFSFGVGSAVNRYLLEEMAALGRGTVQVVRPDEDTSTAVERFQARIDKPVLTDVEIDWKDLAVSGVTPARVPDLFADQPITLHGRYAKGGRATITIRGRMAGRRVSFDVPVELPETREREGVAATWARARIAELTRKQLRGEQEPLKKEIVDLALEHHLMTQYTAFVAVDTTRTTSGGEAQTVAVPVDVPDGVKAPKPYAGYGGGGGGTIGGVGVGTVGYGSGGGYAADYGGYSAHVVPPAQYSLKLEGRVDGDAPARDELESMLKSTPPPVARPAEEAKPDPTSDPKPEPKKAKDTSTTEASMRAQASKCWLDEHVGGSATIDIDVVFDDTGAATSVAVKGADAKVTACITAKAKKWRAAKKRAVMTLVF